MGFRCSLCCLVKGCRPTWLSGKELARGCAVCCASCCASSGTSRLAAKRPCQTPHRACSCRSCMREGSIHQVCGVVVAVRPTSD